MHEIVLQLKLLIPYIFAGIAFDIMMIALFGLIILILMFFWKLKSAD